MEAKTKNLKIKEGMSTENKSGAENKAAIEGGWKYDYDFLQKLASDINRRNKDNHLSMEDVEDVLLAINYSPSPVQGMDEIISHPLDTVIENSIHVNISFKDMCLCLGLNDEGLREFLAERMPINDKIAEGLEKLLGVDKQFWVNRQKNYNNRLSIRTT